MIVNPLFLPDIVAEIRGRPWFFPCDERTATRRTGYVSGGTSPFGSRTLLPVYVEKTIFNLSRIYINGGKQGFLVEIDPGVLREILPLKEVDAAIPPA